MTNTNDEKYYQSHSNEIEWVDEWSFKSANTATYTHKIHKYPAMFIPQLVRKVIERYTNEGDTVLDIFNGSGSTMVECALTGRNAVGIEINPLAQLIAKVKTTKIDIKLLSDCLGMIEGHFYDDGIQFNIIDFDGIDFWFEGDTKVHISKLLTCLSNYQKDVVDFFKVCLSENIRNVSVCNHSGFKMHRDQDKIGVIISKEKFFNMFRKTSLKNIKALETFNNQTKNTKIEIIKGSSTDLQNIPAESIDLILTSPPYGDSQTTVAYGQFSRLSSQCFGFKLDGLPDISQLDKKLLGGIKQNFDIYKNIIERSITIRNINEYFQEKIKSTDDKKKLENRLNDVLSFYYDLDKCLKNGEYYLKKNKHFILVTGSRIVKEFKMHTDLIIAELSEEYNMELTSIFYRNIESKRMPSKGSATNVSGVKNSTINRESIIVLRKN